MSHLEGTDLRRACPRCMSPRCQPESLVKSLVPPGPWRVLGRLQITKQKWLLLGTPNLCVVRQKNLRLVDCDIVAFSTAIQYLKNCHLNWMSVVITGMHFMFLTLYLYFSLCQMTPSQYMFQMSMDTNQKLSNTHTMNIPQKVELLDMSETTHQKVGE